MVCITGIYLLFPDSGVLVLSFYNFAFAKAELKSKAYNQKAHFELTKWAFYIRKKNC
jgi:hypothetical protein